MKSWIIIGCLLLVTAFVGISYNYNLDEGPQGFRLTPSGGSLLSPGFLTAIGTSTVSNQLVSLSDTSAFFGIGTTTPLKALAVVGDGVLTGTLTVGNLVTNVAGTTTHTGGITAVGLASSQGLTLTGGSLVSSGLLQITNVATSTFSGSLSISGGISGANEIVSTRTSHLGWSVMSAANQACVTTCTYACVVGFASAVSGSDPVDCSNATADACLCAGPN